MKKLLFTTAVAIACIAAPANASGPLPAKIVFDYQLGGAYPPPQGVNVVARDSTELPAKGLFNICYVNGFQSQPGSNWPKSLVVKKSDGSALFDPNWPDEFLLDISSEKKRRANLKLMLASIKGCAAKGFNAVEFDNLDSYTRSEGHLTKANALAFAKMLVKAAKHSGLASAQKNLAEVGTQGRDEIGFTFVVAEECHRWDECKAYTDVYGSQVIDIEYTDDLRGTFKSVCADKNTPKATILRDRKLLAPSEKNYAYERC